MARAHFSDDSDEDLPELNELINKHVKSLHILRAPKLDLSGAGRVRINLISPRKLALPRTSVREDADEGSDKERSSPHEQGLAPVSNTQLDQIRPLQASRTRRTQQPDIHVSANFTLSTRTRTNPHRGAKAAVTYSPLKRDGPQAVEDESEVGESIWCGGDDDEQDLSSVRDILSRSSRKSKPRQYTPDADLGDSDDDIFGFKNTPAQPLRTYQSPAKGVQKKLQVHRALSHAEESSDKENDGPALLRL